MQNEELRRTQLELDAEKAHYFGFYDLAPVGFVSLSRRGLILEANLTTATLLGETRSALLKQPLSRYIFEGDRSAYYSYLKRLFDLDPASPGEFDQFLKCELRVVKKDGRIFWVVLDTSIFRDIDDEPVGRLVISDITERHQAAEVLRESEARFRSLLQSIPTVAVQAYGPDGTTQYWNQASEKLYGYTAQEAIGRNVLDMIIPPERRTEVAQAFQQMAQTGKPLPASERSLMRKDGSTVAVFSSHAIVQIPGHPSELFCLDIDLSERKLAEEEIKTSLAEKEVLLKEVHHRVKNNLAAIIGLLNLQELKKDDATTKAALEELSGRIRSMALVHELLYKSGSFSRINFQDYLEELIAHLSSSYERSARFHVSVAAEGVVMGLDSAIPCGLLTTELLTNAFKYAFPEGRPRLGADNCEIAVSVEWDGGTYTLSVADNGVGFPVDMDWTDTNTMGLLLVKMLGQYQLQGRVELDRSCGTTFRLRFEPKANDAWKIRENASV
jgi:PAS domain S-box-containing protein